MTEFKIVQGCTGDEVVDYIRIKTPDFYEKIRLDEYIRDKEKVIKDFLKVRSIHMLEDEIHYHISKAIDEYEVKCISELMNLQMEF